MFVDKNGSVLVKVLIFGIPLVIFGYLLFLHVFVTQEFVYSYDIGGSEEFLSPSTRISDPVSDGSVLFRDLTDNLVYFEVPVPRGADMVDVSVRLRKPAVDQVVLLGARNADVWSYSYHTLYNPSLSKLSEFSNAGSVYRVHDRVPVADLDSLRGIDRVTIASDSGYVAPVNPDISGYETVETVIDTSLRGAHTFFVFVEGDLVVEISKQDINWYEGSDSVEISVFGTDGVLYGDTSIPDDGVTTVESNSLGPLQDGSLRVSGLDRGVYRVEISGFDGLIRRLSFNTNRVIVRNVFFADNDLYSIPTASSSLYTEFVRSGKLEVLTYHAQGLQTVSSGSESFVVDRVGESVLFDTSKGEYEFTFPKSDVIVSGTSFFAFSKDQYFEPFTQNVVSLSANPSWDVLDYVVTDYVSPVVDGDWLVTSASFSIVDEGLVPRDGMLSFVFNVPVLSSDEVNVSVSVDTIEIKVVKPGLLL